MATLKEHQAAMVDLLANGSGIPASASRLAHAMHDVLSAMLDAPKESFAAEMTRLCSERIEATTPGLNDKALSKPQKTLKTDSPAKWPTSAEQRVKELENTIRQLKANNAKLKAELDITRHEVECVRIAYDPAYGAPEQAGVRKEDTQVCEHDYAREYDLGMFTGIHRCVKCGKTI